MAPTNQHGSITLTFLLLLLSVAALLPCAAFVFSAADSPLPTDADGAESVAVVVLDDETGEPEPVLATGDGDGDASEGSDDAAAGTGHGAAAGGAQPRRGRHAGGVGRVGLWTFGDTAAADAAFFDAYDRDARKWRQRNADELRRSRERQQQQESQRQQWGGGDDVLREYDPADNSPEARRARRGARRAQQADSAGGRPSATDRSHPQQRGRSGGLTAADHQARRKVLDAVTSTVEEKAAALTVSTAKFRRFLRSKLRGLDASGEAHQLDALRAALFRSSPTDDHHARNATTLRSAAAAASAWGAAYDMPLVFLSGAAMAELQKDVGRLGSDLNQVIREAERASSGSNKREAALQAKRSKDAVTSAEHTEHTAHDESNAVAAPPDYDAILAGLQHDIRQALADARAVLEHQREVQMRIIDSALGPLQHIVPVLVDEEVSLTARMNANDEATAQKRRELKQLKKRHRHVGALRKEAQELLRTLGGSARQQRAPALLADVLHALQWALRVRRSSVFTALAEQGTGVAVSNAASSESDVVAQEVIQGSKFQSITNVFGLMPLELTKLVLCTAVAFSCYTTAVHPLLERAFFIIFGATFEPSANGRARQLQKFLFPPRTPFKRVLFHFGALFLHSTVGHLIAALACAGIGNTWGLRGLIAALGVLNRWRDQPAAPLPFDTWSHVLWTWWVLATASQKAATLAALLAISFLLAAFVSPALRGVEIRRALAGRSGRVLGSK